MKNKIRGYIKVMFFNFMASKKISEKYLVHNGCFRIEVEIISDNMNSKRLKITDTNGDCEFVFDKSKPETVRQIGRLLVEAADL
jgi:hypothetical protein